MYVHCSQEEENKVLQRHIVGKLKDCHEMLSEGPNLKLLPCTVVSGREIHHLLDFIARPVRVFPEDDALSLSGRRQSHEGVAGGREHSESHTR